MMPWARIKMTAGVVLAVAIVGGGYTGSIAARERKKPRSAKVVKRAKISQFGITWTFDKSYPTGQFANGDYWVVGPVKIINITPLSVVDATGRTLNGSMINPSPRIGLTQGVDSLAYGFKASLNVARPNQKDLSANNPLMVPVNLSLESTISNTSQKKPKGGTQTKTAAILTVLGSAPPAGSFRPSYSGVDKTIKFNKSQLNYSLLKKLAPVENTPTLASVERMFERPWIEYMGTVTVHSFPVFLKTAG